MNRLITTLAMTAAFGAFVHTLAQEAADPYSGREFAQEVCAECHAVLPEDKTSPNAAAASFKAIADTPGMTRTALVVWFQTPHPTTHNLIVDAEDLDNVIAYILSLKDKS